MMLIATTTPNAGGRYGVRLYHNRTSRIALKAVFVSGALSPLTRTLLSLVILTWDETLKTRAASPHLISETLCDDAKWLQRIVP
jgi:hypothetical protein